MKRRVFYPIIIISSLAVLGIFFTQVYWVRESFDLKEEQFENSVRIALKGVVNQLLNYNLTGDRSVHSQVPGQPDYAIPEAGNINPSLLDFKITEEFNCMQVGQDYSYGILDLSTGAIVMGKGAAKAKELIASRHQIPLTGFHESDRFILAAYFPKEGNMLLMRMLNWLVLSVIFALMLLTGFYFTLHFLFRQKKLSEMKSDFISNMTHEFKTPLATISLASEMLMKKEVAENPYKTGRYARIIFDENTRMQNQVEQILNVSLLEQGRFRLKMKETDVHEMINKVVSGFVIIIQKRKGSIQKVLAAAQPVIQADRIHFMNVISNLLDNANKYSPDAPEIVIRTENADGGIIISVEDKGIGISRENQQYIFRNLYRVPTGNIHNVKGFGIGLFYVKTIVEAHGGTISLTSEPEKGARFDVFLPFHSKSHDNEGN